MQSRRAIPLLAVFLLSGCMLPPGDRPYPDRRDRRRTPYQDYRRAPLPKGNVRVVIDRIEVSSLDHDAFEAALRYEDEDVTVQAGRLSGRNGLLLFAAEDGIKAALRAGSRTRRTRRFTQQFLVVAKGGRGSFDVIVRQPVVWTLVVPVYGGGAVLRTIRERVTGSGMEVQIHDVRPEGVDLEVTPYFRRASDGWEVRVTELKTRLVLKPGRPYVLMAERRRADSFARGFLSFHSRSKRTEVIQILRVETGE